MLIAEPTPLDLRVAAAQALLHEWKGRPFDWKARSHCARMVYEHVRRMGYQPAGIGKAGPFASALSAKRALTRVGAANIGDLMDQHGFPRIAPIAALPGDVLELSSGSTLGALTVSLGNGRVIGWTDGHDEAVVLQPTAYERAWKVEPCG